MIRAAVTLSLVLGILCAVWARPAEAHVPPPAYMNLKIEDEQTEVLFVVSFDVFRDWFGVEPAGIPEDGTLTEKQRSKIQTTMAPWLEVRVDGIPAAGVLVDAEPKQFEDHMRTWEYVNLRMRYTTTVPPRQVAFAWTYYGGETGWIFASLDAELEAYGETDYPLFKEREPEYMWHRPREIEKPAPVVLPQPVQSPHLTLPVASILFVLAFVVCAWVLRDRVPRRRVWIGIPVMVLLALLTRDIGRIEVPLPWGGGLQRPPDAEALAIFASLHRGVYEAVTGESEEEIYESLAQSVTDELLPRLYLDIHGSMILQNEGGAIAKIQKTEIQETEIVPVGSSEEPWFKVRARWLVEGKVGHWGHTHQRINKYLADVTVVADQGRWKIAEVEVFDETRVDDGKKVK